MMPMSHMTMSGMTMSVQVYSTGVQYRCTVQVYRCTVPGGEVEVGVGVEKELGDGWVALVVVSAPVPRPNA